MKNIVINKPAIVLVTYNRIESFKRLLSSVINANYNYNDITLVVSIDHSEKSNEIENIAKEAIWKYGNITIIKHEQNLGLRKHVISCGDLSYKYGSVIILEDDLVVAKDYYNYVVNALNHYGNNDKITGISLYSHTWNGYAKYQFIPQKNDYDVFFGQFSVSWGQCWTCEHWDKFKKWYEKNQILPTGIEMPSQIKKWGKQSWGKYFVHYILQNDLYYVMPYYSFSTNFHEAGVHSKKNNDAFQVPLTEFNNHDYKFPSFEEGIKYDIFFERMIDKDFMINDISINDICVDLYGQRANITKKKYILTTRKYLCDDIAHFGLHFRPQEKNVIEKVEGNDIHLYETLTIKNRLGSNLSTILYHYYDINVISTFKYTIIKGFRILISKLF